MTAAAWRTGLCALAAIAAGCAQGPSASAPTDPDVPASPATDAALADPLSNAPDPSGPLLEAERAAWADHDIEPLLELFASDAAIVGGRGPAPDRHDVTHDVAGFRQLMRYQHSGRRVATDATRVEHRDVRASGEGARRRVELVRELKGSLVTEAVREQYDLRWSGSAWQVVRLRWWPLSLRFSSSGRSFGPAGLRELDDAVDALGDEQRREKAIACFEALRYGDSADLYEKVVAARDATPRDWFELGWSAAFAGRMDRAAEAFARARELDPAMPVPVVDAR